MLFCNHYSIAVLVICACVGYSVSYREKRAPYQYEQVLVKVTGRSHLFYENYGCWCGLGRRGTPVDATDSCCQARRMCYRKMVAANCDPNYMTYTYTYTGKNSVKCDCSCDTCKEGLCKCDVDFANCAAASPFDYSKTNYDRSKCV